MPSTLFAITTSNHANVGNHAAGAIVILIVKPIRSILGVVALLLVVALVATACGSDDDNSLATSDNASEPAPDQPTSEEPTLPDEPLGAGPYPIAELTIEYTDGTDTVTYGITCLGDTATLIGSIAGVVDQRACLALADSAVQARLIDGPPDDQTCSAVFGGPDEAVITGRVDDQSVDASVNLRNGCGISDWNGLLADLLPRPSTG